MDIAEAIKHCREKACNTDCGREHEQLAEWLEELQRYKERAWISVKDRLPEEGEKVLIYTKTDITTFGLYTKNYGFGKREGFECGDGFMWMNTSSHWMPLPEPPEGE